MEIDEEKVLLDEQWDGIHGVVTSLSDRSGEEILEQYRGLWQVEDTLRVTKHDLEIRPIYHWTPRRIHAHVAIAFMSLLCTRHLLHRLRLRQVSMSPAAVSNLLARVESWVLDEPRSGKRLAMPFGTGPDVRKIYASVGKKLTTETVLLSWPRHRSCPARRSSRKGV